MAQYRGLASEGGRGTKTHKIQKNEEEKIFTQLKPPLCKGLNKYAN
jgi:hypothetical protein